jgi:CDP-diacylglycerol--glycerol-3-phosphate 3-phosphatidyltransferase
MNLPNKLTVSRLALTLAFLLAVFSRTGAGDALALAVFIAASLTDLFDGRIARQRRQITNFGILMDPLADKVLICSAFIAFVDRGLMPGWMVVIIVARELAITGLRLLAASQNVVLAAEGFGKHKTVSQIVAIIAILVAAGYREWGAAAGAVFGGQLLGRPWVELFTVAAQWWAVALTAVSGGLYLWRNRQLYLDHL